MWLMRLVSMVCAMMPAFLNGEVVAGELKPLTFNCLADAADKFRLDRMSLVLILSVERGKVGECSMNKNRTVDCGPAQVNSVHFTDIARVTGMSKQQVETVVTDDGCFNIYVGAWLLRMAIDSAGGDVWKGMAYYHSHTPEHMERYHNMIMAQYRKFLMPKNMFADRSKDKP